MWYPVTVLYKCYAASLGFLLRSDY